MNEFPESKSYCEKQIIVTKTKGFFRFGKSLVISPKTNVEVCEPGYGIMFHSDSVSVLIAIGKDHTAELVMSADAWKALKSGAEVSITTTKEFKNQDNLLQNSKALLKKEVDV